MKQTNIPVIRITETEISIPTALINMKGVTVVNIVKDDEADTTLLTSPAPESVITSPEPTTHEPTTLPPTVEPTTYEPTTAEATTSEPTTHEPTTYPPKTAEPACSTPRPELLTTTEEAMPTTFPPTTEEPTTSTLESVADDFLRSSRL